jgi:hypothetical protein
MDIENIEVKQEQAERWTSCCLEVDKNAVQFFSQLGISIGVISFCLYQLVHLTECEQQQAYSSLLTLVLGVWLPSPKMKLG